MAATTSTNSVLEHQQLKDMPAVSLDIGRAQVLKYAQVEHKKLEPVFVKISNQLAADILTLDTRNSSIQHSRITPPAESVLKLEFTGLLKQYWGYRAVADKLGEFVHQLKKTAQFLEPTPRTYCAGIKALEDLAPDLHAHIVESDKVAQKSFGIVRDFAGNLDTLHGRMLINLTQYSNHIDRFRQLMENKGLPLAPTTRGWNAAFGMLGSVPQIPTLKEWEAKNTPPKQESAPAATPASSEDASKASEESQVEDDDFVKDPNEFLTEEQKQAKLTADLEKQIAELQAKVGQQSADGIRREDAASTLPNLEVSVSEKAGDSSISAAAPQPVVVSTSTSSSSTTAAFN